MDPQPVPEPIAAPTVAVWWADLTAADLALAGGLDPTETARLDGLDRAADRGRFLLGAALLRVAVAAATGRDRRGVVVTRECSDCGQPHGAPRVQGTAVSVAHAAALVVVATATDAVGVDVDRADRGKDMARWVHQEATFKALSPLPGGAAPLRVLPLSPPLPGYLASLAIPAAQTGGIRVHGLAESAAALRA